MGAAGGRACGGAGQLGAHVKTHVLMLGLAWRTRDWGECAGQGLRLVLVPLGHMFRRLPIGNPGRANVSAFASMPVRDDIASAIALARREAAPTKN